MRALRRLAAERGVSMAALIRESVERILRDGSDHDRKWERALATVGRFRDRKSAPDVAEKHDAYLEEAYRDWRR